MAPPATAVEPAGALPDAAPGPLLELVESFPIETSLDHPDLPEAHDVWVEMIDGARASLDIAQFYISTSEEGRMTAVLAAIDRAARRGVAVRVLVDERFYAKYPDAFESLRAAPRIEGRRLDVRRTSGGVLHAKYFVVDGVEAYLGSHNFDWRALEHIQELGVRIRHARIAEALRATFELDWSAAGSEGPVAAPTPPGSRSGDEWLVRSPGLEVKLALSPRDWLTDPADWDLPQLLRHLGDARSAIDIQLLSYRTDSYDGTAFREIDDALRSAVHRGVRVRLMVSDWADEPAELDPLKSLVEAGVEVRLVSIPPWSGGPIEFARTIHAKYLVVDGEVGWVGTSNFSGDYFYKSRNVGLIVRGAPFVGRLSRFFESGWASEYAHPLAR